MAKRGKNMKPTILLVEDEKNIARFIELELKHDQFEVEVVHDGREGLELASRGSYSCVLLDVIFSFVLGKVLVFHYSSGLQQQSST